MVCIWQLTSKYILPQPGSNTEKTLLEDTDERLDTHACLINIDQTKYGTNVLENLNSLRSLKHYQFLKTIVDGHTIIAILIDGYETMSFLTIFRLRVSTRKKKVLRLRNRKKCYFATFTQRNWKIS